MTLDEIVHPGVVTDPDAGIHALTFDDGPSEWTPAILDLLQAHGARATFFVVTRPEPGFVATLRRMRDEGHAIGNHTFTHKRLTSMTDAEVKFELEVASAVIEAAAEVVPTLWRAPYFGTDERVNQIAAELGMQHVGCSLVTDDWMSGDPEAIARTVITEANPRSVICLHDGIPPDGGSERCTTSRQPTVEAVRLILESGVLA